jgi:hypothetical protein
MIRSLALRGPALLAATVLSLGGLTSCLRTEAYINSGSADGVEVSYPNDPAATLPLARKHCAQYEKVPQLVTSGDNIAVYLCEHR